MKKCALKEYSACAVVIVSFAAALSRFAAWLCSLDRSGRAYFFYYAGWRQLFEVPEIERIDPVHRTP